MTVTAADLERAAKAAATSEYDGPNWRDYIRSVTAAFEAIGLDVATTRVVVDPDNPGHEAEVSV